MKLSKRETVLLGLLLIFALFFIEFKLLYTPWKSNYDVLFAENEKVQNQVDEINRLITSIPALSTKKASTLQELDQAALLFYDTLNTDALLWTTQDLINQSGLSVVSFAISDLQTAKVLPPKSTMVELAYQLKQLAIDYSNVVDQYDKPSPTPTPAPASTQNKNNDQGNAIELFPITVTVSGSYDQLRQFITSMELINKSINISTMSIKSTYDDGMIESILKIDFYGVQKINRSSDESNTWKQEPVPSGSDSPFVPIVVTPTITPQPTPVP